MCDFCHKNCNFEKQAFFQHQFVEVVVLVPFFLAAENVVHSVLALVMCHHSDLEVLIFSDERSSSHSCDLMTSYPDGH